MYSPLESLKRIKNAPTIYVGCASDIYTRYAIECNEIEKALKEKEEQDDLFKALKETIKFEIEYPLIDPNDAGFNVLTVIRINSQRDLENKERKLLRNWVLKTCFPKELKVLEIIKEKRVEILRLDYYGWSLDLYNENMRDEFRLTQEEYDLLKEELYGKEI